MNGHHDFKESGISSSSEEIAHYLLETTRIIEEWVRKGDDPQEPISKYTSSSELRKNVQLTLPEKSNSDEAIFESMRNILTNSVNPWTGRFVDKLYSAPLPIGIASETLLATINANAHVMSAAPMLCLMEEACVNGLTKLCGWDCDLADGMTMPGGSMSNTFAIQTALNNSFVDFKDSGLIGVMTSLMEKYNRSPKAAKPLIVTGAESHYSLEKAALACGMGLDSVVKVPCDEYGNMKVEALEDVLQQAFEDVHGKGEVAGFPFLVNATAGSTVTGSFDDIDRIAEVCEKYRSKYNVPLWLHVDASWGGPILFSSRYRNRMRGIERCDSMTINPHKLLNIPHQCSFIVFRNGDVLERNALDAPYLFHATEPSSEIANDKLQQALNRKQIRHESPAKVNFGCGRKGDALKFYLAWIAKGSLYFGNHVEKGIELAMELVKFIQTNEKVSKQIELANTESSVFSKDVPLFLQVCLRPTLHSQATVKQKSQVTTLVHSALRKQNRFAVDFAPLGHGQGDFIRIVTHPFTSFGNLKALVYQIIEFGQACSSNV